MKRTPNVKPLQTAAAKILDGCKEDLPDGMAVEDVAPPKW